MLMGRVLVVLVFLLSLQGVVCHNKSVGQLEMVRTMRFLVNNADRFQAFMGLIDLYGLDPALLGTAEHLTLMVPNDGAFKRVEQFVNSLTFQEKVKLLEFHGLMDELDFSDKVTPIPESDKVTNDGKRHVVEREVNTLAGLLSGDNEHYMVSALMSNFTILARTGINKPRVLETLRTVPHLKVYEVDQVLIPRALKDKFAATTTEHTTTPNAPSPSAPNAPPPSPPIPTDPVDSGAAPGLLSWFWLAVALSASLLLVK